MPGLTSIYSSISAELEQVRRIFDAQLVSELPVVNELCTHIQRYRGKLLRPVLLLLSAKACGRVSDEHLTLAAVVEMVHMATLVHDDVLDEGDMRRGGPTINCLEGNEAVAEYGRNRRPRPFRPELKSLGGTERTAVDCDAPTLLSSFVTHRDQHA